MARTIKDFNRLIPETRIAKLGGKDIDVTRIPSRVTLQLAQYADDVAEGKLTPKEQFVNALEPVAAVCKLTDPDVTVDWLLDNTDFAQLSEFTKFVLEPIMQQAGGQEPGKKRG